MGATGHATEVGFGNSILPDLSTPRPAVEPDLNDLTIGKWDLFDEPPVTTDPGVNSADPAAPVLVEVDNTSPTDMDSPDIQYQLPQEQEYQAPEEPALEAPQEQVESYLQTTQYVEPEPAESSAQYGTP